MKIGTNAVVSIEYILTDNAGEVIDASEGDPLEFIQGHGQLVPGLERAMEDREVGESFNIIVPPQEGYGEHDPERVIECERSEFPEDLDPEVGMELSSEGPNGEAVTLWIIEVDEGTITLDGNHPLAGEHLHFAIEVLSVRAATDEELSHGHVHGPGQDH